MEQSNKSSAASDQYAAAHQSHYGDKDLSEALGLYAAIVTEHPDSPEAGYSRSQVTAIAKSVLSKEELFDSQLNMALTFLEAKDSDESA